MPFHPNRIQYNTRVRGIQVHPRFLKKLKFYFPLRVDSSTAVPVSRFIDAGPNRYQGIGIGSSFGLIGHDANGPFLYQIGDPYVADYLPVTGSQNDPVGTAFTLMGWARPFTKDPATYTNVGGAGNPYKIVSKLSSGTNVNAGLFVASDSKFKLQFTSSGSYTGNVATSFTLPQAGIWRQYAATYDGSEIVLYMDGQIVGRGSASGTPDDGGTGATNCWYIGRDNVLGGSGGAGYRDVAVWDRVLTPADIAFAYQNRDLMIDSSMSLAYVGRVTPPVAVAPPTGGPYIKVRHGGTGHGDVVRVMSSNGTINYDDYLVEITGDHTIYLPP